jgi:hypothetical protein
LVLVDLVVLRIRITAQTDQIVFLVRLPQLVVVLVVHGLVLDYQEVLAEAELVLLEVQRLLPDRVLPVDLDRPPHPTLDQEVEAVQVVLALEQMEHLLLVDLVVLEQHLLLQE